MYIQRMIPRDPLLDTGKGNLNEGSYVNMGSIKFLERSEAQSDHRKLKGGLSV